MVGMNNTEVLFSNLLKTAQNILTHFDDDKDKRNKLLKDLETIVSNNCAHDEKTKKVNNTVKEIIDQSDIETNKAMELFKERKDELYKYEPDVSKNANFKEFQRQVKEIVNAADGTSRPKLQDDDIEMTQDDISVIDPFTKKRMTDPVKNKICGHVYEQDSVSSMLKMNKNTRCPVVGCINKNPISMENIVSDIVVRKYLHDNPV